MGVTRVTWRLRSDSGNCRRSWPSSVRMSNAVSPGGVDAPVWGPAAASADLLESIQCARATSAIKWDRVSEGGRKLLVLAPLLNSQASGPLAALDARSGSPSEARREKVQPRDKSSSLNAPGTLVRTTEGSIGIAVADVDECYVQRWDYTFASLSLRVWPDDGARPRIPAVQSVKVRQQHYRRGLAS